MSFLGVGAFDIDGTLVHHDAKPDFLSPESLGAGKPDHAVCRRARRLIEAGMDLHFVTGRTHPVRDFTLEQLRRHVHPDIHPSRLHMQEKFTGYDDLAHFKSQILSSIGAEWYVGDHECDERAAHAAGIPFKFANDYQEVSL